MKIYELLDRPEKWTQGTYARDKSGKEEEFNSSYVICWCLLGAVKKCYPEKGTDSKEWNRLKQRISKPVFWNDAPERTYEEVIALCKELDI